MHTRTKLTVRREVQLSKHAACTKNLPQKSKQSTNSLRILTSWLVPSAHSEEQPNHVTVQRTAGVPHSVTVTSQLDLLIPETHRLTLNTANISHTVCQ